MEPTARMHGRLERHKPGLLLVLIASLVGLSLLVGLGMQLAESAVEAFGEDRVEPVSFTAQVKTALAGRLRVLVEAGEIRIPSEADIRNDWHSVRRTMSPGGQVRFEADREGAGHADRFWAAALAVRAADSMVGPMEYLSSGRLTFARAGVW